MEGLGFVSLMAANADPFYRRLVVLLSSATGLPLVVRDGRPWQERQEEVERGEADLAAVCGALYVRLAAQAPAPRLLLAAPVMRATRYGGQPVYFSDVVVRHNSRYQSFADLRGANWAYNEPGSFSGYAVVCAYLAALGEGANYFGSVRAYGSHQEALRQICNGAADAAAIDSIVLERELALHPQRADALRTLATIGPNPIPPLVVSPHLSARTMATLRDALLALHRSAEGAALLHAFAIDRFAAVADADYDPIRQQLRRADAVQLATTLEP